MQNKPRSGNIHSQSMETNEECAMDERIVVIEDTGEIKIGQENCVRLESGHVIADSKTSTRDLVKNSLRMRPDRIIIGELRGGEAFDFLQ